MASRQRCHKDWQERLFDLETPLHEDSPRLGACDECEQCTRLRRIAGLDHREGIRNRVMAVGWESPRESSRR
jgi:hypothetical protein